EVRDHADDEAELGEAGDGVEEPRVHERLAPRELDLPCAGQPRERVEEAREVPCPAPAIVEEALRAVAAAIVAARVHVPGDRAAFRHRRGGEDAALRGDRRQRLPFHRATPSIIPRLAGTVHGQMSYGQRIGPERSAARPPEALTSRKG